MVAKYALLLLWLLYLQQAVAGSGQQAVLVCASNYGVDERNYDHYPQGRRNSRDLDDESDETSADVQDESDNSVDMQGDNDMRGNDKNNHGDDDDDDDDNDDEYRDDRKVNVIKPIPKRKRKKNSTLSKGIESASSVVDMAMKLTKGTVKSAIDLCSTKHVNQRQITGKWRLQQEIELRKGSIINCPASIELLKDGTVISYFNDQEFQSQYIFKEREWPRKCTIEFNCKAFQGPGDTEPRNMYYRGYFKRSIMNPNLIFVRGKVYRLSGKMFWKKQNKIGKFKAVKSSKR